MEAALGFRAHSGWAAMVALAGPPASPMVLDRRRVELQEPGLPVQAYHAARPLGAEEGEELIRRATEGAARRAQEAVGTAIVELESKGHRVVGCGVVLGSGFGVSTLAEALSSHAGRHAAEGELYRQAVIRAGEAHGLPVAGLAERVLYTRAAAGLSVPMDELRRRVTEMGRDLGPPWGSDQKSASLVAWLALAAAAAQART
ncbi:MAG: hypothetical protein HYY03_08435 [Chloroflexi bacterium]|nr:hypothetical protein [Chloroflexota bacterium]